MFARLRFAAIDGVTTDAERLDEGKVIGRQLARRGQLAGGAGKARPQAAAGMDTWDLQVFAAVCAVAPASETLLAIHVRLDRAALAGLEVRHALPDCDDLDAEFVAGDAGITVEGHLAEIAADVGAADADA